MSDPATLDDIDELRKDLEKSLGGRLYLGSDERLRLRKLPLNIASLDAALDGGFAFDRIVLLIGEYSSGKTLLSMLAMKEALDRNLTVGVVDAERSWTPEWAAALGIDPDKVLVARPRTGEEAFQAATAMVKRRVGVVVIDSLAVLRASGELDKPENEILSTQRVGGASQLINAGLATIMAELDGSLVFCINQLRMTPTMYGNPETLPGGRGQRFDAWQIVRVKRGDWLEEGTGAAKRRIGYKLKIIVEKNKQGSPFQTAEVPFYFTGEIDELAGLLDVAQQLGIIGGKPPHYVLEIPNPETGEIVPRKIFGRRRLLDAVRDEPEVREWLDARLAAVKEVEV